MGRGGGLAEKSGEQQGAREGLMRINLREGRVKKSLPKPTLNLATCTCTCSKVPLQIPWMGARRCTASQCFLNHPIETQRLFVGGV